MESFSKLVQSLTSRRAGPAYDLLHGGVSNGRAQQPSQRRLWILYGGPALLVGLFLGTLSRSTGHAPIQQITQQTSNSNIQPVMHYKDFYEPRSNRFLSEEQCHVTFPNLDQEFRRASEYWQAKGGISEATVQLAQDGTLHSPAEGDGWKGMRVIIVDNKLFIRWTNGGPTDRTQSILQMINEAVVTSPERLPDVEFVFDEYDIPPNSGAPVLGLCRRPEMEELWTMPDFAFGTWPRSVQASFETVSDRAAAREAEMSWNDKIGKLFFRGSYWVGRIREYMAREANGHDWSDVQELNWQTGDKVITMDEHCKWKYLAHCEGTVYSGRFKYLSQCRSVMVTHPPNFIQHFTHLLNGDENSNQQNIVITPGREWQGLSDIMNKLLADDANSERIANQSYAFFRHWLSPASTNCAWRSLIRHWAKAQTFQPKLRHSDVDFSTYNVVRELSWNVH